jgi:hypothetical protein
LKNLFFIKVLKLLEQQLLKIQKLIGFKQVILMEKLNLENRFVKKGEKILTLKDGESLIADFAGKVGKREIAQGVLGSESLIITLDDLKKL